MFRRTFARLDALLAGQTLIRKDLAAMSATVDTVAAELAALQTNVAAAQAGEASAIVLIQGIPALITAAVNAATAAGATPDQLAAFAALNASLVASTPALAAAVAAAP
jgi:hypothetical protein